MSNHPFEQSGLGKAPYKFEAMLHKPGRTETCNHCGQRLVYVFKLIGADGFQFQVGSDCVKLVDKPLYRKCKESKDLWLLYMSAPKEQREAEDEFYENCKRVK